jgi:hypothetical protein
MSAGLTIPAGLLDADRLYAVRAVDDSLIGQGIGSGDVLIVDPDAEAVPEDLAVVYVGTQRTLARIGADPDVLLEGVVVMSLTGAGIWSRGGVLTPWSDMDWGTP